MNEFKPMYITYAPARGRRIFRKLLMIAASMAKLPDKINEACVPLSWNMLNINATNAAPELRPNRRAVPSIPLAPPLLLRGAEEMMV